MYFKGTRDIFGINLGEQGISILLKGTFLIGNKGPPFPLGGPHNRCYLPKDPLKIPGLKVGQIFFVLLTCTIAFIC